MGIDYSKPTSPIDQRININPIDEAIQAQLLESAINSLEKDSQQTMSFFDVCM